MSEPTLRAKSPFGLPGRSALSRRPKRHLHAAPAIHARVSPQMTPGNQLTISFQDVKAEIITPGGIKASQTFDRWCIRSIGSSHEAMLFKRVQEFVLGHRHEKLYRLTLDDIAAVSDPCPEDHALGDLDWDQDVIPAVRDFNTPFAIEFILHKYLESFGRIPLWREFYAWFKGEAADLYYDHFKMHFKLARMKPGERERYERALQTRIGPAYYSFIRELHILTSFRQEFRLDARYHLLADVLFRVDFWVPGCIVNVFVGNQRFKDEERGRKDRADAFMSVDSFTSVDVQLPNRRLRGKPYLCSAAEIGEAASAIRAASSRR